MMKVTLLVIALLAAVAVASFHHDPLRMTNAQIDRRFNEFMLQHNKSYATPQEMGMRRNVFRRNLIKAVQMNKAAAGRTRYGITQFMDLTAEEFKVRVLMASTPIRNDNKMHEAEVEVPEVAGAPSMKNWASEGATTPVYNQGQCGSCWAFSATEQTESMYYLQHGSLHKLSMQQVVSCDNNAYGCNGGWTSSAYNYVMQAGGYMSYNSFPYTAENSQCQFNSRDIVVKVTNWNYITQSADEAKMKNYIASTGPLSICAAASAWQFYNGGVMTPDQCEGQIDHCIQLVGYNFGGSMPYWIVRNSWGPQWGERGFIYLQYGQNTCSMGNVVTTCTTAAA